MAKPRVFISSTYYDLKYIRASLELFVDSFGFEPVLSEKGDIAYTHDRPLDESCYREVENSDLLVLIIGGRYGSEASSGSKKHEKAFFERYDSITKKEFENAVEKDIPVFVLIEKGVHSEYQTFVRNKDMHDIRYAHVDSVNVFLLVEDILSRPRNNPIHTFEKFEDIQTWLREQWGGLFRELLRRQSQQQQLAGLSQQIRELKSTNETLKTYLEAVMRGVGEQEKTALIESEEKRLERVRKLDRLRENALIGTIQRVYDVELDKIGAALRDASSVEDFCARIGSISHTGYAEMELRNNLLIRSDFVNALNDARVILGLTPFQEFPGGEMPKSDRVETQKNRNEYTGE